MLSLLQDKSSSKVDAVIGQPGCDRMRSRSQVTSMLSELQQVPDIALSVMPVCGSTISCLPAPRVSSDGMACVRAPGLKCRMSLGDDAGITSLPCAESPAEIRSKLGSHFIDSEKTMEEDIMKQSRSADTRTGGTTNDEPLEVHVAFRRGCVVVVEGGEQPWESNRSFVDGVLMAPQVQNARLAGNSRVTGLAQEACVDRLNSTKDCRHLRFAPDLEGSDCDVQLGSSKQIKDARGSAFLPRQCPDNATESSSDVGGQAGRATACSSFQHAQEQSCSYLGIEGDCVTGTSPSMSLHCRSRPKMSGLEGARCSGEGHDPEQSAKGTDVSEDEAADSRDTLQSSDMTSAARGKWLQVTQRVAHGLSEVQNEPASSSHPDRSSPRIKTTHQSPIVARAEGSRRSSVEVRQTHMGSHVLVLP
jgi:hypothetical protein